MSKADPFAERAARRRRNQDSQSIPDQQAGLPEVPTSFSGDQSSISFAQGRAEKMMTFADLPDPVDTPDAFGDLSSDEEQILALCMRGIKQFENAWWVMGKAMANINARRLYRKTHATFEDFARDIFNKSRPTAYEEMTAYSIGELLSARADKAFDEDSNDVSARADTIGKKAAVTLNTVTQDYGPEVAVAVYETIEDAAGKKMPVKELKGVVTQLPRKQEKELTEEELTGLARELATAKTQTSSDQQDENQQPTSLTALHNALAELTAAHRALAPAKVKLACQEAPDEAAILLPQLRDMCDKVAKRSPSAT